MLTICHYKSETLIFSYIYRVYSLISYQNYKVFKIDMIYAEIYIFHCIYRTFFSYLKMYIVYMITVRVIFGRHMYSHCKFCWYSNFIFLLGIKNLLYIIPNLYNYLSKHFLLFKKKVVKYHGFRRNCLLFIWANASNCMCWPFVATRVKL